ncbi:MAG: cytosine deaminase, partial [Streptomycetaceae bacterium]|nr:cytosine deaminase [Streptomycetaceae bacterium]
MTDTTTLTGATMPDGRVRNVVLRHGSVSHVRPVGIPDPGQAAIDLTGYVLLPAPVEPHLHLDRALTWEPVGSDPGGRDGAVRSWRAWPARYSAADLRRRARTALQALSANGVTAVRTHVDIGVGAGAPLRAVEVLRELREDLHRILDLQIVAVPSPGLADRAALDAFSAGAGLVGGRPHRASDPRAETRRLLRLADRAEVDLDLHLDDQPDSRVLAVADLARLLRASGFGRQVTASHCASLGQLRPPALAKVVEAIAASGMAVVGLPSAARNDTGARAVAPCGGPGPLQALLEA